MARTVTLGSTHHTGAIGDAMSRRPHILMSVAYLLVLCTGFGMGGLWPVYLRGLGAGPMEVGIMNAVSGPANLVGTLLCGWLSDRFRRRRETFIFACSLFTLTWFSMSRATTWQQLTALNLLAGFCFGMCTNMIVIMTGLLSEASSRGRSFGVLTFVSSISLLITGLFWGPIADSRGFPTLLVVDAIICAACAVLGIFFTEPPLVRTAATAPAGLRPRKGGGLGMSYYHLLAATLFATIASYGAGFGRSVAMSQLGFSATAVGLTTAIGGAISLPAPLVLGALSDRIGRKRLLILCYAAGLAALPAIGFASTAWGFWGASALLGIMATCQPLQQALATDMLPRDLVGRGLALLGSAQALSILTSSLVVGAAFQGLGARTTFLLWTVAPLAAIALLAQVREPGRAAETKYGVGTSG
jgi:MFS family permease